MAGALKLLIVDEDPDRRINTRKAALRVQFGVAGEVGYGTKAVSLALDIQPDILLISVEEPVRRPLETAEALANVLPNTPIIIYSSIDDAQSVRRAMLMGARDYIVQPVQPEQLLETINTVLGQEERRQMRLAASRFGIVDVLAPEAVRVENDRIVADPAKMIRGLGYPVAYKGRRWWVENVDGDTIRYSRGPKV